MFPRQTNNTDTFGAGAVLSAMFKPNLGQLQRTGGPRSSKTIGYSRMARMGPCCWCDARPEHTDLAIFLRIPIDKKLSAGIGIV
jgi:hypothetical protein